MKGGDSLVLFKKKKKPQLGQNGSVFTPDVDVMQQTRGPFTGCRRGKRPPGPFKVMTALGVRIKQEGGGFGNLPLAPSLFLTVPLPLHSSASLCLLLLWRLFPLPFVTTVLSAHGTEGGKAPQVHNAIH